MYWCLCCYGLLSEQTLSSSTYGYFIGCLEILCGWLEKKFIVVANELAKYFFIYSLYLLLFVCYYVGERVKYFIDIVV